MTTRAETRFLAENGFLDHKKPLSSLKADG
jgi:hypothetical protein